MRISLATPLILALLAAGPALADYKRITTEADFIAFTTGKTFFNDGGSFKIRKNGRMTGKFGDEAFRANWTWHKGFSCRKGTLGKRDIGTDCQLMETDGKTLRVTRKQGKGRQVVYAAR